MHRPPNLSWDQLIPAEQGLYLSSFVGERTRALAFYDFSIGAIGSLYRFVPYDADRISVSRIDESVLYSGYENRCDLILVDNFL